MLGESALVTPSSSLNIEEKQKKDILSVIETSDSFQKAIEELEKKEDLIWYFVGPLLQDEDIKKQLNLKWKEDFQKFEQSINDTHEKLKSFLPNQDFSVYLTKDNNFKIRFESKGTEQKSIEISNILRANDEDKTYNIPLGQNSQVTASKKGNERHYDFTGSNSCEMTINWQAKDAQGNNINCSITVEVGSGGIKKVIEGKFGEITNNTQKVGNSPSSVGTTDQEEVLKLIKQNKEVFINGKPLYQAFTNIDKGTQQQETTRSPISPPIPSSSGYSSPESVSRSSSRSSSISDHSESSDEVFESNTFDNEEEYEQGEEGLEQENAYLRKQNAELKSRNEKIVEEGDLYRLEFGKSEDRIKELEATLKINEETRRKEFAERDEPIEQLEQEDKNARITDLKAQLEDEKNKESSTNKINEELQEKFNQIEKELKEIKEENRKLKEENKDIATLIDLVAKQEGELEKLHEQNQALLKKDEELEKELKDLTDEKEEESQQQNKTMFSASSQTGTTVYKDQGIQASATTQQREVGVGITVPQVQDQGMQTVGDGANRIIRELRQKITNLTRDKQTVSDQLKQKIKESEELKQKTIRSTGVNASSSIDQKETKEIEIQTEAQVHKENVEKTGNAQQNIMDEPVPQGLHFLQPESIEFATLKKELQQLQEENKRLKQEMTKSTGVNASSSTDQKTPTMD